MDSNRFDALSRTFAASSTRRGILAGIGAALLGARGALAQATCPPGQTRNRKGECSCPAGTDACPDGCFDLKRDPANCGRCGNDCPPNAVCVKGECRCGAGTEACAGACVDPLSYETDPINCGACGATCPSGYRCEGGICQPGGVCFDAGCGGCLGCATSTAGLVCLTAGGISCHPDFACDSLDDCLVHDRGFTHCFTSDMEFYHACVPEGEGRCGDVSITCTP
jgi:hypothetical protein